MQHTRTSNSCYETAKGTTFFKWVFLNSLQDFQKTKDPKKGRKYFSNEVTHCIANTCATAALRHLQAPKPKSNRNKSKQTSEADITLCKSTYCEAKPPSHQKKIDV